MPRGDRYLVHVDVIDDHDAGNVSARIGTSTFLVRLADLKDWSVSLGEVTESAHGSAKPPEEPPRGDAPEGA